MYVEELRWELREEGRSGGEGKWRIGLGGSWGRKGEEAGWKCGGGGERARQSPSEVVVSSFVFWVLLFLYFWFKSKFVEPNKMSLWLSLDCLTIFELELGLTCFVYEPSSSKLKKFELDSELKIHYAYCLFRRNRRT